MAGATEMIIYLTHLLAVHFNMLDLQLIFSNKLFVFFIQPAAMQHAQFSPFISDSPALVLDYKLREYGSVVPQSILTVAAPGDVLCYSSLKMPIFLVHADRKTLGFRLKQAEAGNFAGLLDAHAQAPVEAPDPDSYFRTTRICVRVSVSQVAHHGAIVRITPTSSGQATTNREG